MLSLVWYYLLPWNRFILCNTLKPLLTLSLTASTLCQVEPVGRWFEAFVKRRNRNASASFQELEDKKELSEESEDEELQLEEFPMLKTLDPKDWKVFNIWLLFSQMQFSIIKPRFKMIQQNNHNLAPVYGQILRGTALAIEYYLYWRNPERFHGKGTVWVVLNG